MSLHSRFDEGLSCIIRDFLDEITNPSTICISQMNSIVNTKSRDGIPDGVLVAEEVIIVSAAIRFDSIRFNSIRYVAI